MKKLNYFILSAAIGDIRACGPSDKELAEKARQDSIRIADSIALVEKEMMKQDSIAKAEAAAAAEQARLDSIAAAEANKKGGKKK